MMMVLKSMEPCGTTILCEVIALGKKWNSFLIFMKGGKAMIDPFDNKNDLTNFGTRLKKREESRKLVRMRGRLAKPDHQKNSCGSIKLNNERQKKMLF